MFAVYDEAKTLQYVGFSKGLRDSLRTLFSRRPEKAHYYRRALLVQVHLSLLSLLVQTSSRYMHQAHTSAGT